MFTVQLIEAKGGALLNPNASSRSILIVRNDAPVRISHSYMAVPESVGVINITITRGRLENDQPIGSDDDEVSVTYMVVSSNSSTSVATAGVDFIDLQSRQVVVFPPRVHATQLHFRIIDDDMPEIAESFQVILLEETLRGDAVLMSPSSIHVTIEPNDKPHGVLSISTLAALDPIVVNEDLSMR